MNSIVPIPRNPVRVRDATPADVAFIDSLQKMHNAMVGWMPTQVLEGKVAAGNVLVAEDESGAAVGYVIAQDRYMKREDVGIIYHLNVAPGHQRGLIGATLVKAVFERAAYGCRLFCLWCAQDIAANHFWESIGFVPLAFRAGSRGKRRVHIFWQKRIVEGDTATPWWFPSQTSGGSINEDRLVLPIPPGTHWSDAKPLVLPGAEDDKPKLRLEDAATTGRTRKPKHAPKADRTTASTGLWFSPPPAAAPPAAEKKPREKKPRRKNDPKLIAAARELRDRWLEHVNTGQAALPNARVKYDVSRMLLAPAIAALPLLPGPQLDAA